MNDRDTLPPLAPGLILTLSNQRPVQEVLPYALPIVQEIRPQIVMPHMWPDERCTQVADACRAALARLRVWIQTPANTLADDKPAELDKKVRFWVRNAITAGAEVLVFNGEGASAPGRPGWKRNQPLGETQLTERATLVLATAADEARGSPLVLAWSSHDRLASHGRAGLPVGAIFGPGSPVRFNLNQEYTFVQPRYATFAEARTRHEGTAKDTLSLVQQGVIRRDLASGGSGYAVIAQAHHHEPDALAYYLDSAAFSGAWTIEHGSYDEKGVLALAADARLRERCGHAPGRLGRFRDEMGLGPGRLDGEVLSRLGLTD